MLGFDDAILGASGVLFFALGAYVLARNPRQSASRLTSLTAISLGVVTFLQLFIDSSTEASTIDLAVRLHVLASMISFGPMLVLALELDSGRERAPSRGGRRTILVTVTIAAVLLSLMMDGLPVDTETFQPMGSLGVMLLVSGISLLAGASALSYLRARSNSTDGAFRSQCLILACGTVLTLIGVLSLYINPWIEGIDALAAVCFLATEGVLIDLVVVHKLFQYPKVGGGDMGVSTSVPDLSRAGSTLLLEGKDSEAAYQTLINEISQGKEGLIITRTHPDTVRGTYEVGQVRIIWLCSQPGVDRVDPQSLSILQNVILDHLRTKEKGVILLEGLEYLVSENSIDKVLRLLYTIRDATVISGSKLIMPLDPATMSVKDQAFIEREFSVRIVPPFTDGHH